MQIVRHAAIPVLLAGVLALPASAASAPDHDPLRFFEGRTESISTVKVLFHKSYRTRAIGTGHIRPNGTLELVQQVERAGQPTKVRRWLIREVGDGHYSGKMSDAVGPVSIEEVDGRYRFRFRMKGNLAVEQWVTPRDDWRSASNRLTIKRFGIKVGSSEGVIRKIA